MQDQSNFRESCVTAENDRSGARLRAAARSKLAQARSSRIAKARQIREDLQASRIKIRSLVEGICGATREFIEDDASVRKSDDAGVPDGEDRKWDFSLEGDTALSVTKQDIVRVVEQHPEGVSLMQIGNELGTDWRGLVNWSRRLVIDGKVERLDELFYPTRK